MPKSKASSKRKAQIKKRRDKREKWVARKVAAFNALPEEAKQSMLKRWGFGHKNEGAAGQLGGVSIDPTSMILSPQVKTEVEPVVDDHWKHHESGGSE